MLNTIAKIERIKACILCGAIGDAFGAEYEGKHQVKSPLLPSDLRFTDDTQLTLATIEALTHAKSVSPDTIAENFLNWHNRKKITGYGSAIGHSLKSLKSGVHWAFAGKKGEYSHGNGAAMRIAPLAFLLEPDNLADRTKIKDVCRITHSSDEAYIGALAVISIIHTLLYSEQLDFSWKIPIQKCVDILPDSRVKDGFIKSMSLGENPSISELASNLGTSGFVAESVPFATISASVSLKKSSLLDTLSQVIKQGGDTDTNASICGQVYGVYHGLKCLAEVKELLQNYTWIHEIIDNWIETYPDLIG